MPFRRRNTRGFFEKWTWFLSIFHVASKALCAAASVGTNRAASTTKNESRFIASLLRTELRAPTISELVVTIGSPSSSVHMRPLLLCCFLEPATNGRVPIHRAFCDGWDDSHLTSRNAVVVACCCIFLLL